MMTPTTDKTVLVALGCQALGQHQIAWHGIPLCCVHQYDADEESPRRLYRVPTTNEQEQQ